MRSGTSHCHVRLAEAPVDSPLVSCPSVLLALNEPSLRKFLTWVAPGGTVFYDAPDLPGDCARSDVRIIALPFTQLADRLGNPKAANIVMLGAMVETTKVLSQDHVIAALQRKVKSREWFELDLAALAVGREEARKAALS
jgi:Pyruvate/2-oxoacid:ferredoxin oxidoreductase gamma subunit